MLHSSNGVDWSREDLDTLAGFPTNGVTRIQSSATSVLITLVRLTQPPAGIAPDGTTPDTAPAGTAPARTTPGAEAPIPQTIVLVGTPRT